MLRPCLVKAKHGFPDQSWRTAWHMLSDVQDGWPWKGSPLSSGKMV